MDLQGFMFEKENSLRLVHLIIYNNTNTTNNNNNNNIVISCLALFLKESALKQKKNWLGKTFASRSMRLWLESRTVADIKKKWSDINVVLNEVIHSNES